MPESQEITVEPSLRPLRDAFDAVGIAAGLNPPATITLL